MAQSSAFDPSSVWGVVGGIFLLIFIYLIFKDPAATESIFSTGINGALNGIKALQGR